MTDMITFDPSKYDGYIFDCDGTLADTMPIHYRAWSETLALKLGKPSDFSESMFYQFGGMPARQIVERLNHDYGYDLPAETTAHDKEMRFMELLPGIGPIPEVIDVLNSLPSDAKIAVASGGLTPVVRDTLSFLGMHVGPTEKIKFLVGSDQVKHGKPHPELFLRAAELLGVDPKRCLVFEDAAPGFAAAVAAGMDYIDVRPFRTNISAAARY
jgi:beta-phosphoglucomutase-like phosphatase (HAD superfamily)